MGMSDGHADYRSEARKENPRYKDAKLLEEKYHGEKLSTNEIADEWDCAPNTVRKYMRKNNIPIRSRSEAISNSHDGGDIPTFYTRADKGYEVADSSETGIYIHRLQAVAYWGFEAVKDNHVHHIDGIEWHNTEDNLMLIDPSQHMRHHHGNYNWLDELRAVEMYDEGASSYDISGVIGCSPVTAMNWIHKNAPELTSKEGDAKA